jgi:hypothetical protein
MRGDEMDRKPMWKLAFLLLATVIIISSLAPFSIAFDSNDYGGDSGGGDWGSDSGGDWGSDSGGNWSFGSNTRNDDSTASAIVVLILVVVVVVSIQLNNKAKRDYKQGVASQDGSTRPSTTQGLHIQLPDRTMDIESIIKNHDPNFSASDFVSFVKRVFIDIQTAWCKRDMSTVRPFLHDNLYDATVKQVQAKIDQGVVYHYESIVVNTAYLTSYANDAQYEYLTLYLNARMIDWQEDEKTGRILRGDKNTRWDLRYKMKFMRSVGVLTKESVAGVTGHNCPNCAAPLEMTSSAKCAHCGSNVTTGQYSWVLSDFGTIRDDTVDEGISNSQTGNF